MRIDTFLAYIAGIVDGEGCIDITVQSGQQNTFYSRVQIGMTKAKKLLKLLHEKYDGGFYERKIKSGKIVYTWTVTCRQAENFLRDIYPYLRVKKEQAELVFELNERISLGMFMGKNIFSLTEGEVEERKRLYKKMKQLNK